VRSPRQQFGDGVRIQLPNIAGVTPFGVIAGALTATVMNSAFWSLLITGGVFAGRAQMVAMQLITDGAPLLVVAVAVLVVNLRHLMYGAALAPHFQHLGWRWKALFGILMTDLAYAVTFQHMERMARSEDAPTRHWYFFGACMTNWVAWMIGGAIGALIGGQLPASWGLDFVPTLAFVLALATHAWDRASIVAAVVAGLLSVALAGLPWSLGLFIGALAGLLAGVRAAPRAEAA